MNKSTNETEAADVLHELNVKHLDAVEAEMERCGNLTALEFANEELALAKSIVGDSPDHVAHIAELQAIADAAEIAELKAEAADLVKCTLMHRKERDNAVKAADELKATAKESDLVRAKMATRLNKKDVQIARLTLDRDNALKSNASRLVKLDAQIEEIEELKITEAVLGKASYDARAEIAELNEAAAVEGNAAADLLTESERVARELRDLKAESAKSCEAYNEAADEAARLIRDLTAEAAKLGEQSTRRLKSLKSSRAKVEDLENKIEGLESDARCRDSVINALKEDVAAANGDAAEASESFLKSGWMGFWVGRDDGATIDSVLEMKDDEGKPVFFENYKSDLCLVDKKSEWSLNICRTTGIVSVNNCPLQVTIDRATRAHANVNRLIAARNEIKDCKKARDAWKDSAISRREKITELLAEIKEMESAPVHARLALLEERSVKDGFIISKLKTDEADRAVNASVERECKAAYPVLAEIKAIAEIAEVCLTEGKITRREYEERYQQLNATYSPQSSTTLVYETTKAWAVDEHVNEALLKAYFPNKA